jgi:cobaltochelatase CobT
MSAVIRGAIPVVCNLLAGSLGIEVVWGNFPTASTNGKVVKMPNLPLEGEDLGRWAYGFIAHEAGHCRSTDFGSWPEDQPILRDLTNLLEDPRIEREISANFPGVKRWLTALTEALLEEGMLGCIDADEPPARQLRKWLMYQTGVSAMGYDCLRQMAQQQDRLMDKVFPADTMQQLRECLADAGIATCTAEIRAIAERIQRILGEMDPPAPEPDKPEPAEGEQGDGDQGPEQLASGGEATGDPPQDDDDGDDGPSPQQVQQLQQQLADMLDEGQWGQDPSDKGTMVQAKLGDKIQQAVDQAAAQGHGSSRLHMPMAFSDTSRSDGSAAMASVRRESIAVRAKLEELVEDVTRTHFESARGGRRLRRDAGVRMARGNLRVFDRRTDGLDVDAAVHLLLDKSTSMRDRLDAARDAAIALTTSFADIDGVDTAVSAFPETVTKGGRIDPNGVRLVKRFDEDFRAAAGRVRALAVEGVTPLASALLHCHEHLLSQPRQRRIVAVATDGDPDSLIEARDVITAGRRAGIEHIGIGIGVELGHLFDVFVRINTVADLPRHIVHLVRDALFEREQLLAA